MIEKYGKFVALDGTEFPYGDFHSGRKEAAAKAKAHDKADYHRAGETKGPTVDDPRIVGARHTTGNSCRANPPRGRKEAPAAKTAGIKLPYPLTLPAKPLTPGEESAKQTFMEMHLAAARAQASAGTRNHVLTPAFKQVIPFYSFTLWRSPMNDPTNNDVMEKAIQAAKDAGACCPESVAEILAPASLSSRRWPVRQSFATRKMVQSRWRQPSPNYRRIRPSRGYSSTARAWTCAS